MYSPKVKSSLVPKLYHLAKYIGRLIGKRYPMTQLINEILEEYLSKQKFMKL